jgi:Subtilase family
MKTHRASSSLISRSPAHLVGKCLALAPLFFGLLPLAPVRAAEPPTWVAAEKSPRVVAERQPDHLRRLGIPSWHDYAYRGQGIKVAILDSGFRGYQSFLGKELPAQVQARSFRRDGNLEARNSQHGILCADVVHTLAPEAQLLFANWEPNDPATFLDAVRWARTQGAQLISCSCIMPDWSDGEGGGAVHGELAKILGAGDNQNDVLFFGCVGNTAQRHWRGLFESDGEGFHQWTRGHIDNLLSPWGDDRVSVELYCRPGTTYELVVQDSLCDGEVARSTTDCQGERCTAAARFVPEPGHNYRARVRLARGEPGPFHLVALHSDLQNATADGSICFPGDGREVIAVGAVTQTGRRCAYSACGPNSSLQKPDLVAPVPFPSRCRLQAFSGTSAATPQAAGIAALLWSTHPDWTPDRVRRSLLASAHDLGPPGHDWETGYGLIRLPAFNSTVQR